MTHFVRLLFLTAALSFAPPATACMTCDEGSSSPLSELATADDDLRIDLRTGFTFRRTSEIGDVIIDAPEGSLPGGEGAVPGLVGYISLSGTPDRYVHVDVPRRVTLMTAGGGELVIESIVLDQQSPLRLDGAGRLELSFAGVLQAGVSPRAGSYSGDFAISAEYE